MIRTLSNKLLHKVLTRCTTETVLKQNITVWPHMRKKKSSLGDLIKDVERFVDEVQKFENDVIKKTPIKQLFARSVIQPTENTRMLSFDIDVSGFEPEEVHTSVKGNTLTIRAKSVKHGDDGSKFHQEVMREIELPENADGSEVRTKVKDGVLKIQVPFKD